MRSRGPGIFDAIFSGIESARAIIEEQIRQSEPTTWLLIVGGAVILWLVLGRSRR
jgi:hypothetical protein